MPEAILCIVLVALVINSVTFAGAFWLLRRTGATQLRVARPAAPGETMNYFIAGMLNQAEPAFQFIVDDLKGGITYADFRNTGWSAQATANTIIDDIHDHQYTKVRVFAISVGDQVARYLDSYYGDDYEAQLEIVAINPCSYAIGIMNERAWCVANIGTYAGALGCFLLGWLSIVPMPFLPTPGGNYSLYLLVCQGVQILDYQTPGSIRQTIGIVVSEEDEFLDRDGLLEYFDGVPAVCIPHCKHGDTIGNAAAYREAANQILTNSKL